MPVGGKLRAIYISAGHDYWGRQGEGRMQAGIQTVEKVECVAGKGLVGDRYFAMREDFKGQVTFFDLEVHQAIKERFKIPKLPASVYRRNLIVEGINLAQLKGKTFRFGGLLFEGAQECKPCHWMDRVIAEGAEDYLKPFFRGGLRAKILSSGQLLVDRT